MLSLGEPAYALRMLEYVVHVMMTPWSVRMVFLAWKLSSAVCN